MKKPQLMALAAALALAATGVHAQSYNDNGSPVNGSGINIDGPYVPSGGPICPSGPVVSAFTGATTQLGRIFRDGVAATCPIKAYPGIFSATATFNYESYTYSNTSAAAACVTVNFEPDTAGASPCATNAHMSAYVGSYDPNNQGTNFLGDVGSSLAQPFSVEIAANSDIVLVVTNTSAQAVCTFGFEVLNLPCTAATNADLTVGVSAAPPAAGINTPVDFTVTSTNGGPDPAQDVVISLDLGTGFTFNSVTAAGAVCTDPGVGSGGVVSCTFAGATAAAASQSMVVNAQAPAVGAQVLTASTSSTNTDPVPADNSSIFTYVVSVGAPEPTELPVGNPLALLILGLSLAGLGWVGARRYARQH